MVCVVESHYKDQFRGRKEVILQQNVTYILWQRRQNTVIGGYYRGLGVPTRKTGVWCFALFTKSFGDLDYFSYLCTENGDFT